MTSPYYLDVVGHAENQVVTVVSQDIFCPDSFNSLSQCFGIWSFFLATLFLTISHKFPLGLEPGYFLSSFVQFRHVDPLEKILNELWLVAWSTLMHKYAMCICSSSFTGSSSTYLTPFTIVPGGKNESPAVWDLDMTLQIIICSHLDSCLFLMCFLCV